MTLLQSVLTEFDVEPTTEVTVVDAEGPGHPVSNRQRSPEDAEVERIALRRKGSAEAQFIGPESWSLSNLMLMAWSGCLRRGEDDSVGFVIRFRDGTALEGTLNIRKRSDRDLAAHCRRVDSFRKAFCPNLSAKEATPMFRFFLSNYVVPAAVAA